MKNGAVFENEVTAVKCSKNLDFGVNKATIDFYGKINQDESQSLICPSNNLDLNLKGGSFDPNQ